MARFTLQNPGQIRGDQLVAEVNAATGLALSVADAVFYPPDEVEMAVPAGQMAAVQAVIDAHVPQAVYDGADRRRVHGGDVRARFAASALAERTPQEIYTLMQEQIDGWGSLADAKADLRGWLPLLAAAIAWLVVEE